jgi:hypothetical protein
METLVARGILAEDGFNPSGLKKGVTAKMTQYGQAALERTAAPGAVKVMDPVQERVLSAEQAIAEQYPGGDVSALGDRLLSDIVTIFQELQGRGELDQYLDLLSRCNERRPTWSRARERSANGSAWIPRRASRA